MSRIIFGVIASLVLIGISYFTAKMYALGFRFSSTSTKIFFLGFLVLSILFALSIVLARGGSTVFGSALYTVIQTLSGFALYLFIGALALGLCVLVSRIGSFALPVAVAKVTLSAALLLGSIGLVQARFVKTVQYTVTLPGAPAAWNGKVAALVADTHFGIINKKRFSDKVVQKIISLQPDFVLHAGDFYDGPRLDTVPITASWKVLAERFPVFYAPGNHEQYGDYGGFIASIKAAGVIVLEDAKATYDGIDIAGFLYRNQNDASAVQAAAEQLSLTQTPSIAIIHTPVFHSELRNAGVDLVVSGHTHRGQFWPLNYLIKRIYGNYAYGLTMDSSLSAIITSGVGTFGPPFRLFNTPEIVLIRFNAQ